MGRQAGSTALLTREQVLAASDLVTEDVPVPEWGGTLRIKGLSGRERDAFEASIVVGRGAKKDLNLRNARARLVAYAAVDVEGKRVFDDADVLALGQKSALALQRVFDVASRLSGLDEDAIATMADDLGNAPSDASGSG